MLRRITLAAIVLAMVAALLIVNLKPAQIQAQQQTERITEDDPRWDCRTMGNKVCGPNAPKPAYQCRGITKKGERCKRKVKTENAYCWQHKSQAK